VNAIICGTRFNIVIEAKFKAFVQTSKVWVAFTIILQKKCNYFTALCEKKDMKNWFCVDGGVGS
jgi:hypothetical protein